jgi:hypothetical protein
MGKGEAERRASAPDSSRKQNEAGIGMPSLGILPPQDARPGMNGSAGSATPLPENYAKVNAPGATLYLDNLRLIEPVVKLPEGDTAEHTLVAVKGCQEASVLIQGPKLKRTIDLEKELKPRKGELKIDSKPAHALVSMDGKLLGPAPLTVQEYNACDEHTFVLKKENYKEFLRHFERDTVTWNEISETLGSVSLSEIPPGLLKFAAVPSYPIEVYEGKTPVPWKDGTLTLPEGVHNLTLKSSKVFFSRSLRVEITGSKTTALNEEWPGLGSITIQAEPSNCKIYVDEEYLDYPPINGHDIVAGTHAIKAVPDNDPSQARTEQVVIEAGKSVVQTFTFNR